MIQLQFLSVLIFMVTMQYHDFWGRVKDFFTIQRVGMYTSITLMISEKLVYLDLMVINSFNGKDLKKFNLI